MTRKLPVNPPPSSMNARSSMRGNRARDTGPERQLRHALFESGLVGYRLHPPRLVGRPDIAFPRWKLAVFVNGCFWHRCPICRPQLPKSHKAFWKQKFRLNRERDARKIRELEHLGWDSLVVWECQLKSDLAGQVQRVARTLARAKDE